MDTGRLFFGWNSLSLPLCLIFFALCGGFWRKCLPYKCVCVCVLYLSACTHAFRWPQGLLRVHWTGRGVLISHCGGEWLAGSSHYTFLPTGGAGDPNGSGVTRAKAYIWSSSCLNNRSQLYMWFDVHNPRTLVLKMNKCIKSIVFTQAFQIL